MANGSNLLPVVLGAGAGIALAYFLSREAGATPVPVQPPATGYVAPAFGDSPFPSTGYLGLPYSWYGVNDLSATVRSGTEYSVKQFITPLDVDAYTYPTYPVEEALCRMFEDVAVLPYILDPTTEYFRYPIETLVSGGDCEDTAMLLVSMFQNRLADSWVAAGVFVDTTGQMYGHAWAIARIPGKGEFLFESTLDTPDIVAYWYDVRHTAVAQHYIPWVYWNQTGVYIETAANYRNIFSNPLISTGAGDPAKKRDEIVKVWRELG